MDVGKEIFNNYDRDSQEAALKLYFNPDTKTLRVEIFALGGFIRAVDIDNIGGLILDASNKICPACGRKSIKYRYRLTRVIVSALRKLYDVGGRAKMKDIKKLTNQEYACFGRLCYFGLAVFEKGKQWQITNTGVEFLKGKKSIPAWIVEISGRVLHESDEKLFVFDVDECVQLQEDFLKQAASSLSLFASDPDFEIGRQRGLK